MPRNRDRFLLSSQPDNPVISTAEGIRKEENSIGGQGGGGGEYTEELVGRSAGARRLRPAPAYSSHTLLTARAGDE